MYKTKDCNKVSWCDRDHGHLGDCINASEAEVRDGVLQIRIPLDFLPAVLEGAWAAGGLQTRYRITNIDIFAKELCTALNREDEIGTTPVHRLFDKAIEDALDQGADGIEEHPEQDA